VLVDYSYTTLGLDLDYVIPFAPVPENGREIDGLDDKLGCSSTVGLPIHSV
jgi:fatty acid synthase subunit alpha, fungi type